MDGAPKFKEYNKEKYSNRVFSINKGTVDLMDSIGAWDTIKSIRCQPVKQMQVSKLNIHLRTINIQTKDFFRRYGMLVLMP